MDLNHPDRRPQKPWTPELDKRTAVFATNKHETLSEFLDFLEGDGIILARWFEDKEKHPSSDYRHVLTPTHERYEVLLSRFFGIDHDRLGVEQARLLRYIRARDTYDADRKERARLAVERYNERAQERGTDG